MAIHQRAYVEHSDGQPILLSSDCFCHSELLLILTEHLCEWDNPKIHNSFKKGRQGKHCFVHSAEAISSSYLFEMFFYAASAQYVSLDLESFTHSINKVKF